MLGFPIIILRNKQRSKQGFTLIELIIVIAIALTLAAIAIPIFSRTLPSYYSRAEARELVVQFKKAKLAAAKHNRDVYIDFINVGVQGGQYRIFVNIDRDANTPRVFDASAGDILLADIQLQQSVRFLSTTFANSQAGYNSRGLPQPMGSVVMGNGTAGSRPYTLSVSVTGNVRVQ